MLNNENNPGAFTSEDCDNNKTKNMTQFRLSFTLFRYEEVVQETVMLSLHSGFSWLPTI